MAILLFKLNPNLSIRDPQTSELGQNIIRSSIDMIDKIGYDHFTFKKLAEKMGSTEASVYRYFENKHRLLLYLLDWYWVWFDYRLEFRLQNISNPSERLRVCLRFLCEEKKNDPDIPFVDEQKLHSIMVAEFEKTYLRKEVDADNREGFFLPYKTVCKRIAGIVSEVNPKYPFPHSLISTIMLSANHQLYYAQHLPTLSDLKSEARNRHDKLFNFLEEIVISTITLKAR